MLGGFFFSYLKTEQVKWLSVDFFSSFPKHKTTTKAMSCTSIVVLRLLFGSLKGINSITEMYNLNITRFTEKNCLKYFNAKKSQVLLNGLNKQKSITLCTAVIKNNEQKSCFRNVWSRLSEQKWCKNASLFCLIVSIERHQVYISYMNLNRPYSYTRYKTGTRFKWRLMRDNVGK